jgi:NAD(P)-dependent dehydrogenase (short-subunit alcohol dehydrogenase family)
MTSSVAINPLSLFELSGQSVVITGASGAMGHAIAVALAAMGVKLLLVSGSQVALEEVANEARTTGATVSTLVVRPETLSDAEAIIARGVELYGRVDSVLVASGFNKPAAIEAMSLDDWEEIMDANVRGPWLLAKAYGDHAAVRGGARSPGVAGGIYGVLHLQGGGRFTHQDTGDGMGTAGYQRERDRPFGFSFHSHRLDLLRYRRR